MEKLIFLILVVPIFIFVLYLGVSAIMTGFKAKGENATGKDEEKESQPNNTNTNLDNIPNLSNELFKLNELLKSGALTKEEFDKVKKKLLDN
tara:strand:+ start:113 stop:388 length:276 start_codon:yes stop_codon:yes gene_type:complete